MTGFVKISDAVSLAFHAAAYLASREGVMVSSREIAKRYSLSVSHLAKVMRRLSRAGIVKASTGPRGGFTLTAPPDEFTLRDIYEAVESKIQTKGCLLDKETCGCNCMLGDLLTGLNLEISRKLETTKLSDIRM